jgi:hypothetical protein
MPLLLLLCMNNTQKIKTHVFYKDQILKDANPATFTYDFATDVATDGKLKFKDGVVIE